MIIMFSIEYIGVLLSIKDIISLNENRIFPMNNNNLNFIIPLITCKPCARYNKPNDKIYTPTNLKKNIRVFMLYYLAYRFYLNIS